MTHSLNEILHRPVIELIDEEALPQDFETAHRLLQTNIRRLGGVVREIPGQTMVTRLRDEAHTMFSPGPAQNKAFEYVDFLTEDFTDEPDAVYSEAELWAYIHAMYIYVVRMPKGR